MTVIKVVIEARYEVNTKEPSDFKDVYECIEEAVDKLRELGSAEIRELS